MDKTWTKVKNRTKKEPPNRSSGVLKNWQKALQIKDYLQASSIATATATVAPTMGLLPIPVAQEITAK